MKVHYAKLLAAIVYTGATTIKVRELMTSPLPEVNPGDVLIVPEKTAKFLSRAGQPFERVDIDGLITNASQVEQIADDAVAKIDELTKTNLELEHQVKVLEDEKGDFETRVTDEIEDLKKENQELNDKLLLASKDEVETAPRKTTARKTTKAAGGNS